MKYRTPIDIHEAAVEHFHPQDERGQVLPDALVGALASAVRRTRENSDALVALADALDRTVTPDAGALKLRENALRLAAATAKKLDEAKAEVEAEIAQIEERTGTPPPPKSTVDASLEAEIRARLAAMPDRNRDEVIDKAFKERDASVLSAVLRGPAFLAGVPQSKHDMIRHRYRMAFHAEDYARRDRLRSALEATERSGRSFIKFVGQLTSGQAVTVAEASAANARIAEQAVAAATTD